MNKFKRYKCDTCNKEVDLDNNATHAFIDKCNLTQGCDGKLRLIGEKNSKENILNFDPILQLDSIGGSSGPVVLPEYIDAASSANNFAVLAVKSSEATIIDSSTVVLTLNEVLSKEREYKEFTFNLAVPVNAISGKDSSIEQKVLMFDETDSITVFINGQEIEDTEYTAANNVIRFNSQISYSDFSSASLFVKVLIFSIEAPNTKYLAFRRNVQNLGSSAWSNVKSIFLAGEQYELFTCLDFLSLTLNTRLNVASATLNNQSLDLNKIYLLLAEAPFGPLDRISTQVIPLADVDSNVNHFKYELVSDSSPRFLATSLTLTSMFPAISPKEVFVYADEVDTVGATADDTSKNSTITKTNQFILGPV